MAEITGSDRPHRPYELTRALKCSRAVHAGLAPVKPLLRATDIAAKPDACKGIGTLHAFSNALLSRGWQARNSQSLGIGLHSATRYLICL